jgi:hypothetical protein
LGEGLGVRVFNAALDDLMSCYVKLAPPLV